MKILFRRLIFYLLIVFTIGNFSCDNPDSKENNDDPSRWSRYGLEGYDVKKLRLFDEQLYAITDNHGLFRRNIHLESSEWQYLGFEDSLSDIPNPARIWDVYVNTNTPQDIMVSSNRLVSNQMLYISHDDGVTWQPSDSTLVYYEEGDSLDTALPLELAGFGNTVFAACEFYGIYKSEDFGATWDSLLPKSIYNQFWKIEVHPLHHTFVWASSTNDFWGYDNIIKSTDDGESWNIGAEETGRFQFIYDVKLHSTDQNVLYVSADGNVYKTQDGGSNWYSLFANGFDYATICIDEEQPEHIFVLNRNQGLHFDRLFESWNGGVDWSPIEYTYEVFTYAYMIYDPVDYYLYFPTQAGVIRYKSD